MNTTFALKTMIAMPAPALPLAVNSYALSPMPLTCFALVAPCPIWVCSAAENWAAVTWLAVALSG